jgi:hypothetical protein
VYFLLEITNINRITLKFLNKSSGVVVNGDDSREKGFGFYEEYEAVVHTPMSNAFVYVVYACSKPLAKFWNSVACVFFANC